MLRLLLFCVYLFDVTLSSPGVAPLLTLRDGTKIPSFGLGTWLGMDNGSRVAPKGEEVEKAVEWAIEAGYRHIDTAHIYDTEPQVGRAVNKKIADGTVTRDELFITTKLWNDKHEQKEVLEGLRDSLKKLNLDYVDLYLIHWPFGQYKNGTFYDTDYVETWQGMVEAKKLGLTKSIGVSNFNQQQIDRVLANSDEKPAVLQVEINLNLQQPSLLAYCRERGILVTGYTPFGSLFPSKARPDAPPPRLHDQALRDLARAHHKTETQLVLRYLMDLGVIPIPKTVTKSRVEENIDVFDFQLTDAERDTLRAFDANYRTVNPVWWSTHQYYPFHKQ